MQWASFTLTLIAGSFEDEKVIDLNFWETPYIIILFELGLVMDISNFEITNYEMGWVLAFIKLQVEGGLGF
jgi:hypothetical protein